MDLTIYNGYQSNLLGFAKEGFIKFDSNIERNGDYICNLRAIDVIELHCNLVKLTISIL